MQIFLKEITRKIQFQVNFQHHLTSAETQGFARKSFDTGSQGEIKPFDPVGTFGKYGMHPLGNEGGVYVQAVRVDPFGSAFQKFFHQYRYVFLCPFTHDESRMPARFGVYGVNYAIFILFALFSRLGFGLLSPCHEGNQLVHLVNLPVWQFGFRQDSCDFQLGSHHAGMRNSHFLRNGPGSHASAMQAHKFFLFGLVHPFDGVRLSEFLFAVFALVKLYVFVLAFFDVFWFFAVAGH